MEKRDRILSIAAGLITACCGYIFELDYLNIAESGLSLSSIVLAVYVAAIIGLINSELAKKMQNTISASRGRTQLGVLTSYFKTAATFSVLTILISSIMLLVPEPLENASKVILYTWSVVSILGLVVYVENLVFLVMILRFMLNRQIWDA